MQPEIVSASRWLSAEGAPSRVRGLQAAGRRRNFLKIEKFSNLSNFIFSAFAGIFENFSQNNMFFMNRMSYPFIRKCYVIRGKLERLECILTFSNHVYCCLATVKASSKPIFSSLAPNIYVPSYYLDMQFWVNNIDFSQNLKVLHVSQIFRNFRWKWNFSGSTKIQGSYLAIIG